LFCELNKFILSNNNYFNLTKYDKRGNKNTTEIKYNSYYKELADFLSAYKYIEVTIEKKMYYMFLIIPSFGMYLYEGIWFSKMVNTNKIKFYDIAKLIYIFYYNNIY
jgi:hypothetical protein